MFNCIEINIIESLKEEILNVFMSSISDFYGIIRSNPLSLSLEIIEDNISSFVNKIKNLYKSLIEYFLNSTFDAIIIEIFRSLYFNNNGIFLYAVNKKQKVILTSVGPLRLVRSVLRCKTMLIV